MASMGHPKETNWRCPLREAKPGEGFGCHFTRLRQLVKADGSNRSMDSFGFKLFFPYLVAVFG